MKKEFEVTRLKPLALFLGTVTVLSSCGAPQDVRSDKDELRVPAYLLVATDPYTSVWSSMDNLHGGPVKHWMGKDFPFPGVTKVDGQVYRFMGTGELELFSLVRTSEQGKWTAKYTTTKSVDDWQDAGFSDTAWKGDEGALGIMKNEGITKTQWGEEYVQIRRKADTRDNLQGRNVYLEYSYDDDAIIYVDGVEVVDTGNLAKKHILVKLSEKVTAVLKQGRNLIVVYCNDHVVDGLIDCGLLVEKDNIQDLIQTVVQKSANVQVMQTNYKFTCGSVDPELIFIPPLFIDNLNLTARPVNYLIHRVASNDGETHNVELYFETGPQWALNQPHQEAVAEGSIEGNLVYPKVESHNQEILGKKDDDIRTGQGHFCLVADKENSTCATGDGKTLRESFIDGQLTSLRVDGSDKLALVHLLGEMKKAERHLFLGYDDLYSVQYSGENLRSYWNCIGIETILSQSARASKECDALMDRCTVFDANLTKEATEAGGHKYVCFSYISPSPRDLL